MKFRTTLILLAILAVLGGYVLLAERPSPTGGAPLSGRDASGFEAATPEPVILSYNAAEVKALLLTRGDGSQRTELALGEDGLWHLRAPVQDQADQGAVIRLVESLAELRPQRALTGTVGPLADYELDPPAMQVEIGMQDQVTHTLKLGAANPTGSAYYGQVAGDKTVYLLPFYIGSDVDRMLNTPPIQPTPEPTVAETATP